MKQLIKNYTFNAAAKTVTLTEFVAPLKPERLLLITNVKTGQLIYNFADPTKLATFSGNVITLAFDTTSMSNTDSLQIFYDTIPTDNIVEAVQAIGTEQVTWRRNFNTVGAPNTTYWTTVLGTNQTAQQTGGNLVLTTGTTANAATSVTSKQTFSLPLRAQFTVLLSQRIANQSFYVELVNAAGDTYAGYLMDGTSATTAKATSANGGFGVTATSITTGTTAANLILELDARAEAIDWNDVPANNAGAKTSRVRRTDNILDPFEEYYLRIRAVNGSTAPASNTTFTIGGVLIQDSTKFVAEIAGGRQTTSVAESLPVYMTAHAGTLATTSIANVSSQTGLSSQFYTGATPLTNTKTSVKTSAGGIYYLYVKNNDTQDIWIQVYNVALASVTVGTTVPTNSFFVPAGGVISESWNPIPLIYGTAIVVAATTTERGATAPTTGATVQMRYS